MSDFRRILIIKPSSLGDIVHALPVLSALRSRYPQAHVAWLVKRQWAELLERAVGLDRVWTVNGGPMSWLSLVPQLRAEQFDLVVDLQGLFRSGAMAWLSGGRMRIGFANSREGSRWCYTHRVQVPTPDMHAIDRYFLIAKALGVPDGMSPSWSIRFHPEDEQEVERLLRRHGLTPSATWIAMSVSARWSTKRWPARSFAATADHLQREGAGPVVLIGGAEEQGDVEEVKKFMVTKPIDLTGQTPVGLLPALLKTAAVLVTNDSGPMHIAAAVNTPVVSLFGPTSPTRTGPYGAGHAVLMYRIPCSPCFSRVCHNMPQLECLTSISPEQVLAAVRERLAVKLAH